MISEFPKEISDFIQRHQYLLLKERDAELEQSTLLLSNCPPKLLEQRGLALVNLGVANITIGLGGRRLKKEILSLEQSNLMLVHKSSNIGTSRDVSFYSSTS